MDEGFQRELVRRTEPGGTCSMHLSRGTCPHAQEAVKKETHPLVSLPRFPFLPLHCTAVGSRSPLGSPPCTRGSSDTLVIVTHALTHRLAPGDCDAQARPRSRQPTCPRDRRLPARATPQAGSTAPKDHRIRIYFGSPWLPWAPWAAWACWCARKQRSNRASGETWCAR